MDLLEFRNLHFSFDKENKVLNNINLKIPHGGITLISGPNGSGKTVLFKHAVMLYTCDSGEVLLNGKVLSKKNPYSAEALSYVFQDADAGIIGDTVLGDIMYGPRSMNLSDSEVLEISLEALRETDLLHKKDSHTFELSGGEKRRLAIAQSLSVTKEAIILDEPFANLDYRSIQKLLTILLNLEEKGITLIIITHELEKLLFHAKRVIIIDKGEVKEDFLPKTEGLKDLRKYGVRLFGTEDLKKLTWLE